MRVSACRAGPRDAGGVADAHGHWPLFTQPAAALALSVGDATAVARVVAGAASVTVDPTLMAVGLTDIAGTVGDV
jgi:hypothetical protein